MILQPAKCTNCGANLEVDSSKDAAICQYCGSAFIVEKAINNYTYHTENKIDHVDVVNIYHTGNDDYEISAGRLINYRGASVDAVVPNGIIAIGPHAFSGLDMLKSITISDGVEIIEAGAFDGCKKLDRVTIPASVQSIAPDAFAHCHNIQHVNCPSMDKFRDLFVKTPFYRRNYGKKWECAFCDHINPPEANWCENCNLLKIEF